jgi:hypothetical protein
MTIPVTLLWRVKIPLQQKLGLLGVFSLTIITVIFTLVRLLVVPNDEIASDITWTVMWTNIEMSVCKVSRETRRLELLANGP